eukprot:g12210.t1
MKKRGRKYHSIEGSVLYHTSSYGEHRDVKYWRSKLRRLCAKYKTELKDLNAEINVLRKDKTVYVEQLFPIYVQNLEDISKLKKKVADLTLAWELAKSKKNPQRFAERKFAKIHVKNNILEEDILNAEKAAIKKQNLYELCKTELQTLKIWQVKQLENKINKLSTKPKSSAIQTKFRRLQARQKKYTIEIENFQAQSVVQKHKLKKCKKVLKKNVWNKKFEKKVTKVEILKAEVSRLREVLRTVISKCRKIESLTQKQGQLKQEVCVLKDKFKALDVDLGACYIEDKDEYLKKNHELTKRIITQEQMIGNYRDSHGEAQWRITKILEFISTNKGKPKVVEEHKQPNDQDAFTEALNAADENDQRNRMIKSLQNMLLEHKILDETEPKIMTALSFMTKKLDRIDKKLAKYDIDKLKEKYKTSKHHIQSALSLFKNMKDSAKIRIEGVSTRYAAIKLKLEQSPVLQMLNSLEQQIQYFAHVNHHSKEVLRDVLREHIRAQRRGIKKQCEKKLDDYSAVTVCDSEKQDNVNMEVPTAAIDQETMPIQINTSTQDHWLSGAIPLRVAQEIPKEEILKHQAKDGTGSNNINQGLLPTPRNISDQDIFTTQTNTKSMAPLHTTYGKMLFRAHMSPYPPSHSSQTLHGIDSVSPHLLRHTRRSFKRSEPDGDATTIQANADNIMDYQAPHPMQHAPTSNFGHSNNARINNSGLTPHVILPPPSSPPPIFEARPSTSVDQLQLRKLIDSRGERERLNSLRSTLPHPSKATYFNKHDDKYKNEIAFVKHRQRHVSIKDLDKSIRKGANGSLRRVRKR